MALSFNGSTQYLNLATSPITSPPFTMACWFYTGVTASYQVLMQIWTGTQDTQRLILFNDGTLRAQSTVSGTFPTSNGGSYSTSTWQHAMGVWSSATSRTCYLNGTAGSTNTTSCTPSVSQFRMGVDNGGYYFSGRIAEAAIWNAALGSTVADMLYRGMSPLSVQPDLLIAYWPIMGRFSPEISVVGGGNLTLVNTPTNVAHPRIYHPASANGLKLTAAAPVAGARCYLPLLGVG